MSGVRKSSLDEHAQHSPRIRLRVLDARLNPSQPVLNEARNGAGHLGDSCGRQTIAMIAHDAKKAAMIAWARVNAAKLRGNRIVATETTGLLLKSELGLNPELVNSGPLGGDQQIGALIARGELDMLIFFIDSLGVHPHASDIQSLIRLATLRDIPAAYSPSTAHFLAGKLAQPRAVVGL
jgi:methylglyoxal synthase